MGLGSFDTAESTWQKMLGDESGGRQFNADGSTLTSPKGALGIAQVMPYTGAEAAGYAGLPWDPKKLAQDPDYNKALGRAYYQHQLQTFGSPDLAAAAYNAGPAAVQKAQAMAQARGGTYLDYLPRETQAYVRNVGGSSGAAALTGIPEQDILGGALNPVSPTAAVAGQAAAGIAPKPLPPLAVPEEDVLGGALAGKGATSTPVAASAPGVLAGAIPIDPKNYIPAGAQINPQSDVVDPTQPFSQQLAAAGRSALGYGKQQIGGIPSAIAQDYRGATALNVLGNQQLNSGNALPSFPSSDPRTWSAGGVINALGGVAGQVTAPLTGATRQLVEQPVTDATGNPVAGEAAGMVANSLALPALGRAAGAAPNALGNATLGALPAEDAQLAHLATQKYGIPLTAPQLSTSPGLKIASSTIDRLPLSGAGDQVAQQQSAFNNAVAQTMGETADRITPDVMNNARQRIGNMYNQVAANTNLSVDNKFLLDLHDTLNNASQVLPKAEAEPLIRQAQNIMEKIDPNTATISGKTYQALTNTGAPLDRLLNSENPNVAYFANGLKQTLDGALERSATPDQQAALKTADKQWAAMRTIQPIVAKSPTGDVSPALLAGRVNAATGNGMAFGYGGDLGELARIGQRFLKEPGSSNTAERGSVMWALTKAGALPGALLGASHYGLMPAAGALSAIPAGLAAGRIAGSALRSRGLANALISRSLNPAQGASFSPSLGALGAGAGILNEPVNALGAGNQ